MNNGLRVLFLDFESLIGFKSTFQSREKVTYLNNLTNKLDMYVVFILQSEQDLPLYFNKVTELGFNNSRMVGGLVSTSDVLSDISEYLSTSKRTITEHFAILPYSFESNSTADNIYFCLDKLSAFESKNCYTKFKKVVEDTKEQTKIAAIKEEPEIFTSKLAQNLKKELTDLNSEPLTRQSQLKEAEQVLEDTDLSLQKSSKSHAKVYEDLRDVLASTYDKLDENSIKKILKKKGVYTINTFNLRYGVVPFTLLAIPQILYKPLGYWVILTLFTTYIFLDFLSYTLYNKQPKG